MHSDEPPTILPTADLSLWRLAETSRLMAHPSRLALLEILAHEGTAPLDLLEIRTGLSNPTVRQHLRLLRRSGVIEPGEKLPSPGGPGRRRLTYRLDGDRVDLVGHDLSAFLDRLGAGAS